MYCRRRPTTVTIVGQLYAKAVQLSFMLLNTVRTGLYKRYNFCSDVAAVSVLCFSSFAFHISKNKIVIYHTCANSNVRKFHFSILPFA